MRAEPRAPDRKGHGMSRSPRKVPSSSRARVLLAIATMCSCAALGPTILDTALGIECHDPRCGRRSTLTRPLARVEREQKNATHEALLHQSSPSCRPCRIARLPTRWRPRLPSNQGWPEATVASGWAPLWSWTECPRTGQRLDSCFLMLVVIATNTPRVRQPPERRRGPRLDK